MEMTIQQVKDTLPLVNIRLGNSVFKAATSGRKQQFAIVWLPAPGVHYYKKIKHQHWQYSWEAVCRAVNSGVPLEV